MGEIPGRYHSLHGDLSRNGRSQRVFRFELTRMLDNAASDTRLRVSRTRKRTHLTASYLDGSRGRFPRVPKDLFRIPSQ